MPVRLRRSRRQHPAGRRRVWFSSTKAAPHAPSAAAPRPDGARSSASARTGGITCSGTGTLTASGSTAQANAISAWAKAYQAACNGANINYGGGGSGKGVTDFTAGTDDFAGSDFPLTADAEAGADKVCSGGEAVDLPMAPGGIAIAYNLPGVTDLNLSAGDDRQDLQRQDHRPGTTRPSRPTTPASRCRAPPSRPSTGRTAPAPRSTSPTT